MTNEVKNEPELRFPEFEGEWIEKKLGELLSFSNGINASKEQYGSGIKFINVLDILNNNFILSENIIGKVDVSQNIEERNKVEYGDIVFLRSSETREEVGLCNVYLDKENHALFGGFVIRGKRCANYHPFFLKLLLNNSSVRKSISSLAGGSTRFNISQDILNSIKVWLTEISEQQKIGAFFSKLDQQIELEEQKLEKLEEQKKGYMQQIFSQQLRFKDENGNDYPNWEEVQLKDILIPRNYKQVPEINAPLMSFTSTGGIEPKGDRYNREFLVKNKNKKYKRTEFNDLIYSSNNLDVGAIGLNRYGTSVISDVYEIFKIEEQVSPYFIEMSILQLEFIYKILRYRQGALYGQYRIHANDFLKINIELPCSEEQYKIGDFVNKLDNIIDILNNKIELLKQRKKGFLQKMLV